MIVEKPVVIDVPVPPAPTPPPPAPIPQPPPPPPPEPPKPTYSLIPIISSQRANLKTETSGNKNGNFSGNLYL